MLSNIWLNLLWTSCYGGILPRQIQWLVKGNFQDEFLFFQIVDLAKTCEPIDSSGDIISVQNRIAGIMVNVLVFQIDNRCYENKVKIVMINNSTNNNNANNYLKKRNTKIPRHNVRFVLYKHDQLECLEQCLPEECCFNHITL
jgi:hypothetical protein